MFVRFSWHGRPAVSVLRLATLAMQQAMLGGTDDSMDGTEEEDDEEEEEEGIDEEEEEDEEEDEEIERGRQMAHRDLGLNHNEGLE